MSDDPPPVARTHEIIGWANPRCLRCGRLLMELIAHPAPCRRVPVVVKATSDGAKERAS